MSKSLKILPLREENDDRKYKINKVLPKIPFNISIVASVRSGKTYVINSLLFRFYKGVFKTIYYISPSVMNDKSCFAIRNNEYHDENIICIYENLRDLDTILKCIQQNQMDDGCEEDILVVLDDCLGYLRSGYEKLVSKFRHYRISLITSIQYLRKLPPVQRANTTAWLVFKLPSKEQKKLEEEMEEVDDFMKYYREATKDKYSFLYYNVDNGNLYKRFEYLLRN